MQNEGKILLEIVTPYKKVLSEYVDEVRMPGSEGELGILYDHAPLLTSLITGEVVYTIGKKEEALAVSWGFAEVLGDRVTILVETAEIAHEIDIARARADMDKAEAKLKGNLATEQEYLDANMSLKKATARISVGSKLIK
ncbi:F0F1 ATP synthase subunit epsilon [Thermodesulfobacteriota bacterium]